ncbi:MAG: hydrogen gas-evolving membrane-bound hydrogenase subunit E [Salinirussus sp.]
MDPTPTVVFALLALPFLGAAILPVVYRVLGERTAYVAAAIATACLLLVVSQIGTVGAVTISWIPTLGIELALYLDGLAILIALLASGIGVLVFVYSAGYMHHEPGKARYYPTMLAFMGSMLGVALAADLITLFVFWELTSLTSFLLIGHYRDDSGRYAARKAMLITVAGGLFLLVGFLLLHSVSEPALGVSTFRLAGETSLLGNAAAVQDALREAGLFLPVVGLIAIGAAAKSAQVPLHVWLPDAMEAPTPVSAFLHSATMVKAGVYLIGRFRPLLESTEWTLLFATIGLLTMVVTAVLAVGARDIKQLLAYSTASHLGLITAGFGFAGVVGAETGAFHIVNHALFKAALFLVAGIVAHETGTRAIAEIGGLWEHLPLTGLVAVVTGLGMAGIPPFNGFYSKELLFEVTYEAAHAAGGLWWIAPIVAVLGSVFTVLYSLRFIAMFFGEYSAPRRPGRPPRSMLVPAGILAALAALVGIGGITGTIGLHLGGLETFVSRIAMAAGAEHPSFSYYLPTSLKPAVLMSVATIVIGIGAYPSYGRLHRGVRFLAAIRPTSPERAYDLIIGRLDRTTIVDRIQNGRLDTGARLLSLGVVALAIWPMLLALRTLPAVQPAGVTVAIGAVLLTAVVGAIAVTRAPSHVSGVLTLSILGFMIAIFYILASAPDLALTQLVVETLVLVLFLLVIDQLPAFYGSINRLRGAADAVISVAVGLTVFIAVVLSTAAQPDDALADFFVRHGGVPAEHGPILIDAGGGGNIVNVILVDFRALDTLGEISVIGMAALTILALIAHRNLGEAE